MDVEVVWDSGPVAFRLQGREYAVEELLDIWYGRGDVFFRVRANDGNLILRRDEHAPDGGWTLESFRAAK